MTTDTAAAPSPMDTLIEQHGDIEFEIFKFSLTLLRPWYAKRREFAAQIPHFWQSAIDKSELLGEQISYEDNEILESLIDLHIEWHKDPKIYTISMRFQDNKYTKACELSKEFNTSQNTCGMAQVPWKRQSVKGGFFEWFENTGPSAFEIAQTFALEIFPQAHNFWNLDDENELKEWDISESESSDAGGRQAEA